MRKTNFSSLSSRFLNVMAVVAIIMMALPVNPAYAASITVTNTNDDLSSGNGCSLREAIINANDDAATHPDCAAGTGADTIVLQSGSTYTFSLAGASSTAGDLDISDADGLTIQTSGATNAIIDANDIDRVIDIGTGSGPVTINRITITNGNALTGGGIRHGGTATLTVKNSTISSNIATGTAGCGAGIYNNTSAAIIISNSTFEGNSCDTATSDGGGLWKGSGGALAVSNSTFYNNVANDDGGAIRITTGVSATIMNSTFANNTAGNRGGGLQVNEATATVDFSTFSGNAANGNIDNNGGAIQVSNNGSATVTASILANSTAGQDCDLSITGSATLTNTIVETNVDCTMVSAITSDPALGPLADNGGPTQTMAIDQSSPAYNTASSCGSTTTDQRGIARPQLGSCDLGAFEFPDNTVSLYSDRSSIDFGEQLYYIKSDPVTTTLTNYQSTSVTIGSFLRSSGQFIFSNNNCVGATLSSGQSCTFDMQFKPTAYGALSGTLTINSDATNSPNVISLNGIGLSGTQLVTKGGSFEQDKDNDTIPDFWETSGLTALDGMSNQYARHGSYSVKLVGQSGVEKTLKKTITKNGAAGDDFLFVLWSRAQTVPNGFKYRTQISFYNGNSLVERRIKDYTSGTHDWEYRWLPITVSGNYTRIEIEIIYSLPSGTVWFDSNSLKWAP